MSKKIIVWDLGATKCAAGLVEYHPETHKLSCHKKFSIKVADADSLEHLVLCIEEGLDLAMSDADAICIGAAGQFNGETLHLESGYPYSMHFAQLAKQQHWAPYHIVHDYVPIVCATFTAYMNQTDNLKHLHHAPLNPYSRRVACGIGTGLGLKDGVLLNNGDFWLGYNEIGHIGITTPPSAEKFLLQRHREFIHFLQHDHLLKPGEALTFEKILSGQGLVRLHQFFYRDNQYITPEEVGQQMKAGRTPEILDAFAWYIGLFIGTVQLIFMPEGGIWITGGVALSHLGIFDNPELFKGIHTSPSYLPERQKYPLGILCNPDHALMGGGYYASKRLLRA